MPHVILSGISGHLGSVLSRLLQNAGFNVHGLSRRTTVPRVSGDLHTLPDIHCIDGKTETLLAIFERVRPDVVIHLAAQARREHLPSDIMPFITANILYGTQLLEAARSVGCQNFVTTGSYLQFNESGAYRPFNLYSSTKQAFDNILEYYVDAYGITAVMLTLCNIYSEIEQRPTLVSQMATAYINAAPLHLHAEEAWVDLVHVEDAAAAFLQVLRLLSTDQIRTSALNRFSITSGEYATYDGLMRIFEDLGMRRPVISYGMSKSPARRVRPWLGTVVPGWTQKIDLAGGMKRLVTRLKITSDIMEDA